MEAWLNQNLVSASLAKQAVEQMGFDDKQLQDFLDSYYNYDSNYSEGFYIAGTDGTLLRANPVRAVEPPFSTEHWAAQTARCNPRFPHWQCR